MEDTNPKEKYHKLGDIKIKKFPSSLERQATCGNFLALRKTPRVNQLRVRGDFEFRSPCLLTLLYVDL